MMAIEMTGGVYCPLSPQDPNYRLQSLLQQTQCRLVLVHSLTKTKLADDILSINIDSIMINDNVNNDIDHDILSNIVITPESIAYIIFTSGSTGIPKAVSHEGDNEFCNI
jgi:non-ribosomal peptide synthetase component F